MSRTDVELPPDDPWFGYVNTIVEVLRPDAEDLAVRAAPAGKVGAWPWSTDAPVFVLTAWDPGNDRFDRDENRRRQRELDAELRSAPHTWRARGFDPATGYRDEGVAVRGLPERAVREIGARFGQDAVFCWTPSQWAILSCTGERRLVLGWSVNPSRVR